MPNFQKVVRIKISMEEVKNEVVATLEEGVAPEEAPHEEETPNEEV